MISKGKSERAVDVWWEREQIDEMSKDRLRRKETEIDGEIREEIFKNL